MRTAPQRERFDTPKAISLSQSDVPATKSTPGHQSTAPATKFAQKAPECCACHKIQSKRSKVLRLSRKAKLATNSKSSKVLDLPRNPTLTRLRHASKTIARDCGARMILTNFDMLQARQNKPIARQGQRKRRRRKHYDAPAKQDTSKRPPPDRKSQWHGNENTQPSKTLRLRSETTRRASRSYDSRTGPTKTALADPSKTRLNPNGTHFSPHRGRLRTVADGCGRLRTVANGCKRLRTLEQLLANTASTPRPPLIIATQWEKGGSGKIPISRHL